MSDTEITVQKYYRAEWISYHVEEGRLFGSKNALNEICFCDFVGVHDSANTKEKFTLIFSKKRGMKTSFEI